MKSEQEASRPRAHRGFCSPTPCTRPATSCSARATSCPWARTSCRTSSNTRQIARRFNERYGRVFPRARGPAHRRRARSPALTGARCRRATATPSCLSRYGRGDGQAHQEVPDRLRALHHLRSGQPPGRVGPAHHGGSLCTGARRAGDRRAEIGNGGRGRSSRRYVTESVNGFLAPIRERRMELDRRYGLRRRTSCARATAAPTRSPMQTLDRSARGHGHGVLGKRKAALGRLFQ